MEGAPKDGAEAELAAGAPKESAAAVEEPPKEGAAAAALLTVLVRGEASALGFTVYGFGYGFGFRV